MAEYTVGNETWRRTRADVFWGEIAPCDHVVQIYENDQTLIQVLSQFVKGGLEADDGVIVIATRQHLADLEAALEDSGTNISSYLNKQYFPLDAEKLLARFMVNGWPNEALFMNLVSSIIGKVRDSNRKVRAFGEMVTLLWERGHSVATIQLERLWNKFCEKEMFCLFCAYPQSGFSSEWKNSTEHICSAHSKLIAPSQEAATEIVYRRIEHEKSV